MVALQPDPAQVYPRYLFAALRSDLVRKRIDNMHVGTLIPHFKKGDFGSLMIPLVEELDQRRIGDLYYELSSKIESNRRITAGALALARAYVDRATAGRPLIPSRAALEVRMGSAFKGSSFTEPGIGRPLLRIRDLKTFESQTWTSEVRKDETVIHTGDIVVGMDAEFRATLWLGTDSVLNQRVCLFRGLPGVGRAFVLASLEPELAFQEQAKTGTTVIHLNKADIDSFSVPDLSTREHHDLASVTEPLIELAAARSIENRALVSTRDTLLLEMMCGRVRVSTATDAAEAAA
jgi:type I restriction enzyme S subunit